MAVSPGRWSAMEDFAKAMERLFAAGRIEVQTYGRTSRPYPKLVIREIKKDSVQHAVRRSSPCSPCNLCDGHPLILRAGCTRAPAYDVGRTSAP